MFRNRLSSLRQIFASKKQRFFSSEAAAVPEAYSGAVQFMHWTMGGAMLACVGKFVSLCFDA